MIITLEQAGKKYNSEWIFRDVSCRFETGTGYAILGKNGSGKSTLLRVISGHLTPTEGKIKFTNGQKEIPASDIFRQLAIVAPYQELIEEFTLEELLKFHFSFKKLLAGLTLKDIPGMLNFSTGYKKHIREYSSGMKQRVKILLALLSDVPVLLLDEPAMNLDASGMDWYLDLVNRYALDRLMIVCSNLEQQETSCCKEKIRIEDFKPAEKQVR